MVLLWFRGTIIIAYVVKAVVGLRPTAEAESQGLDITDHGEEGYIHSTLHLNLTTHEIHHRHHQALQTRRG